MPRKGGCRFNLTSLILAQIDKFDTGQNLAASVSAWYPVRRGAKHVDADKGAAARASIKLEQGDIGRMSCPSYHLRQLIRSVRNQLL